METHSSQKMFPALAVKSLPPDTLEQFQNGERENCNDFRELFNQNVLKSFIKKSSKKGNCQKTRQSMMSHQWNYDNSLDASTQPTIRCLC